MNETLAKILRTYSTQTHQTYAHELYGLPKDTVVALFIDLLTTYINDKNSSTIREFITVSIAGYTHNTNKIGFNGFKHTTSGKSIACEAKPKNIFSQDLTDYLNGTRKTFHKLRGNGNFTDYTWARLAKDKAAHLHMLGSGFVDGKLLYLLEFPFKTPTFIQKLETQLHTMFPHGDESGKYLRSATFSYKDFIADNQTKLVYHASDISNYQDYIVRDFYQTLVSFQ